MSHSGLAPAQQPASDDFDFFEKRIRPVLVAECYSCHSAQADEIEGGLALDTREGIRRGGELGPAVEPGNVRRSLLIKAIKQQDEKLRMPPEKKLSAEVVADFEQWIAMGAPDPRDGKAAVAHKYEVDLEAGREHWAFRLPQPPPIPPTKDRDWPLTDVDRFVLAKLESQQLAPVGDADRRTLLRRLAFDLTGLPPASADVDAFAADDSPQAFEAAVDRLLDSPRFGEKWARHWLDVARYAESTGKTVNFYYPQAWRYRDYVIAAFNADKPYDQFIKEQLAGDLMPTDDPRVAAERMIATGFLAVGPKTLNERSGLKFELDEVDEQIDVTTQAFLGITVACARCHDHKFDPIPQADYYALAGIFRSTETCYGTVSYINAQRVTQLLKLPEESQVASAVTALSDRERERIEDQIQRVRDSMSSSTDGLQRFFASGRMSLLRAKLADYEQDGTPKLQAMGVRDKPVREFSRFGAGQRRRFGDYTFDGSRTIADSPVYIRGEPDQPGDARIPRGTLQVIPGDPLEVPARSSGRLQLAEWIASAENPLTARVMANRVWLQLFGSGLVPTAGDFGLAGRTPTHPELLDHLAIRLVEEGWSVKRLIKYLVMSRVYRLGSDSTPAALEADPENVLLWRMAPRRLDAECLRDAMLAVSGQLESNPPVGSAVALAGEGPVSSFGRSAAMAAVNDPRNAHRSIYLPMIRDNLPEAMTLFDAADPSLITSERQQTIIPSQGLYLLNNEFVLRAADATAEKLLEATGEVSDEQRVQEAFRRCYGRPPRGGEQVAAVEFMKQYRDRLSRERVRSTRREAELWSAFCQALFASAEFQYRK
ncbi:MAG: PSD1 domain-containing protein [Planctomycetales bacterium]|nr:PSD1 domain-containing protein [Planctomycetales bacterium]